MPKLKMIIAAIAASILPGISVTAVAASLQVLHLAQTEILPNAAAVEQLANKSLAYWFLTLAGIAIASWTWIVKWLIAQLESQRQANAETNRQLIQYMSEDRVGLVADRANLVATLDKVAGVIDRCVQKLGNN